MGGGVPYGLLTDVVRGGVVCGVGGLVLLGDDIGLVVDVTSEGARGALLQACFVNAYRVFGVLSIVALSVLGGQVGLVESFPLVVLFVGE